MYTRSCNSTISVKPMLDAASTFILPNFLISIGAKTMPRTRTFIRRVVLRSPASVLPAEVKKLNYATQLVILDNALMPQAMLNTSIIQKYLFCDSCLGAFNKPDPGAVLLCLTTHPFGGAFVSKDYKDYAADGAQNGKTRR